MDQKNSECQPDMTKTLEEVAANFDALIASMPANVYWVDKDLIYRGCSNKVLKVFGFSLADIVGKSHDELAELAGWSEEVTSFKTDNLEVLTTGRPKLNIEEPPVKDKEGNTIYFLTSRVPLYDTNKQIKGVLGISIDITERKKIESALQGANYELKRLHEEKLELLAQLNRKVLGTSTLYSDKPEEYANSIKRHLENVIACMPGNVYWMDKESNYLGCNDNVAKTLGLKSREDIVGKTYSDFAKLLILSTEQIESFKRDDMDVLTTGRPKLNVEEPPIQDANGNTLHFLTSRVPIRDQEGQVIGVVGISIDITERKKMEQNLLEAKELAEASDRAKIAFLENMRHDIRTTSGGYYRRGRYD